MLEHLVRIARNGHRIYLISDFHGFDAAHELLLKRIARHNSVVLIHISDPLEQELPPPDRYTVTDGVERSVLVTSVRARAQQYHDGFRAHVALVRRRVRRDAQSVHQLVDATRPSARDSANA